MGQTDGTEADAVCTPCVNRYDALDNLARNYKGPLEAFHLWKLFANAIVTD